MADLAMLPPVHDLDEVAIIDAINEAEVLSVHEPFQQIPHSPLKLPESTASAAMLTPFLFVNSLKEKMDHRLNTVSPTAGNTADLLSSQSSSAMLKSESDAINLKSMSRTQLTWAGIVVFPNFVLPLVTLAIQFSILRFISIDVSASIGEQGVVISTASTILQRGAIALYSITAISEAQQVIDLLRFLYAFPVNTTPSLIPLKVTRMVSGASVISSGLHIVFKWSYSLFVLFPKGLMSIMMLVVGNSIISLSKSNRSVLLVLAVLMIVCQVDQIIYKCVTPRYMRLTVDAMPPLTNYNDSVLSNAFLIIRPYIVLLFVLIAVASH
jgi:hypothetical protein